MEPYSEYFASQLAAAMGISAVTYHLEMWKDKLASVCPLMNDIDTALVSFWAATGESICNVDRHANNFGLLRDNRTGKIKGFAPLFDHNFSLFSRDMEGDFAQFKKRADTIMVLRTGNLSQRGM